MKIKYRARTIISRDLYIFTPSFTAVYNQERLILQTIYLLNKIYRTRAIISRGLYSFTPFLTAVSNQELSRMIEITFTCPSMVFDFLPIFIPFQSIICMIFDNINNNTFFFFLRVRCSSNWPMKSILNYQLEPKQKNWKYLNFCHKH